VGDPSAHSVDPLSLSSQQLIQLACTVARIGTVICDLGKVSALVHEIADPPYIWDTKED
jgi:hypothetical protein